MCRYWAIPVAVVSMAGIELKVEPKDVADILDKDIVIV